MLDVLTYEENLGAAFVDYFLEDKAPIICSPALPIVVLAPRKLWVAEDLSGTSFWFPIIEDLFLECMPFTLASVVFTICCWPGELCGPLPFWLLKTGFELTYDILTIF